MPKRGINKETIKVGSVTLPLWLHKKGWRAAYRNEAGEWKYITRKDKREVKEEARKQAAKINNQTAETSLSHDEAALWQRVKKLGITHADLDEWEKSHSMEMITTTQAADRFMAVKNANRGRSAKNIQTLSRIMESLKKQIGDIVISQVTSQHLNAWLDSFAKVSARRKKNLRAGAVTFFRWCRENDLVPDKKTSAEKLDKPIVPRKVPHTYTPAEMRSLLDACPAPYISWLVLAAFNGLRYEELFLDDGSEKAPLDWSDIKWERGIIIVRPETAKTGHRRVIDLQDVTRKWLEPLQQDSGPICPSRQPHRPISRATNAITKQLGDLIGGWKTNALRHSFISYRAAQVGLAKTAMEAGNSEGEAKKSYNDAKSEAEAKKWFSLFPSEHLGTVLNKHSKSTH